MGVDELDTFRRQPSLAAAGGYAQAEIRHVRREARQGVIGIAATPQAFGGGPD